MICIRITPCPLVPALVKRVSVPKYSSWSSPNPSGPLGSSCLLFSPGGNIYNQQLRKRWKTFWWNISHFRMMASGVEASELRRQNRLSLERSPYLLQHASNPVDWYPWCEEAFEKAKKENKLIFLSVGYSTCHWCHVMERESFENEEIAKVMNDNFINIKVDREERPDVDKIYMTFIQATSGRGGWPMSVFLTPDLKPVAGGTYFPPHDLWGRPGFKSVLLTLLKQWQKNSQKFIDSGSQILEVLKKTVVLDEAEAGPTVPGPECWEKCFQQLSGSFETKFGGFGQAPKFPQPVNFNFLFHIYGKEPNTERGKNALEICTYTLKMMAKGGIHDHISQGFARYSTDDRWHVPHFEKMLYDQAQLAVVYTSAYLATKDQFFADVIRDILTYVSRDLSDESGGFYSAEDADSLPTHESKNKKEGAFCVWTFEEVNKLLDESVEGNASVKLADIFCHHYNVKAGGNVSQQQDHQSELKNQNVLIVFGSEEETAEKFGITIETLRGALAKARGILYEARLKRPRPHLDDKMLTAWNGLMVSGFARAGQALGDSSYIKRAVAAAKFIKKHLYDAEKGTLLRSCYRGSEGNVAQIASPINGFCDDYAFVIRGLLDLYMASFDEAWLEWAEKLQDVQDKLFWDVNGAAYYTSAADDPTIVIRIKEDQDGAEPSGNSVTAHNLVRLAGVLDRHDLREKAGTLLSAFTTRLTRIPIALPEMISAVMMYHDSPVQVFVTGSPENPDTVALLSEVNSRMLPGRTVAVVDQREDSFLYRRCQIIRKMKPVQGKAAAYVCKDNMCSLPVTSPEELAELLEKRD